MSPLPFGFSSMVDFQISDVDKGMDKEYIEKFIRALIDAIGMKIHKNKEGHEHLYVDKWAAEKHPETFGVSGICFLTTSSLSIHTTDSGKIMLDLFSCQDYTMDTVRRVIKEYFGEVSWYLGNKILR